MVEGTEPRLGDRTQSSAFFFQLHYGNDHRNDEVMDPRGFKGNYAQSSGHRKYSINADFCTLPSSNGGRAAIMLTAKKCIKTVSDFNPKYLEAEMGGVSQIVEDLLG